jgi:hypothetical protein
VEWVLKVNWIEKFLFIKLRFPMEWVLCTRQMTRLKA